MSHVVLLGDSIFDNAPYISGGPDVINQVREQLPQGWKATLKAVDGSVTRDVHTQLEHMPNDASHVIVSVGGNDALNRIGILSEGAQSVAEVLNLLADISERFHRDYPQMLQSVLSHGRATAVCTIYYPCFPDPDLQRIAVTALALFNDCIIHEAFVAGIPLLDLRLICNENTDYANPIEPSVSGGAKIAKAIKDVVTQHDFEKRRTVVFT